MTPAQRRQLALEALAGTETVSRLAGEHAVSRKFVYHQTAKAAEALEAAFSPKQPDEERVLFYLPVTKAWLRQLIIALTLICHSSLRGVVELLRDLFDYPRQKNRERVVAPKITDATKQQINTAKELKQETLEFRLSA